MRMSNARGCHGKWEKHSFYKWASRDGVSLISDSIMDALQLPDIYYYEDEKDYNTYTYTQLHIQNTSTCYSFLNGMGWVGWIGKHPPKVQHNNFNKQPAVQERYRTTDADQWQH